MRITSDQTQTEITICGVRCGQKGRRPIHRKCRSMKSLGPGSLKSGTSVVSALMTYPLSFPLRWTVRSPMKPALKAFSVHLFLDRPSLVILSQHGQEMSVQTHTPVEHCCSLKA